MNRPSHICEFAVKDLLGSVLPPLLTLGIFAGLMHAGGPAGLLPKPLPTLDADRTILLHQASARVKPGEAKIILIGDSSCLMDVSAVRLTALSEGARPVLNLGTVSYLDLTAFGSVLRHAVASDRETSRTVVLLMHPEALRRSEPSDYHVELLRHFYNQADYCPPSVSPILCYLGVETFRGRVLSRVMPQPLSGAFGHYYGFTSDLWNYLSENRGSAIDPAQFDASTAQGNAEYRLAPSLEAASKVFRSNVPENARLLVGITPVPQSFAGPSYSEVHRRMLKTWSQWLRADTTLDELPAMMPDGLFANTTHLNKRGVEVFSAELGSLLASKLP